MDVYAGVLVHSKEDYFKRIEEIGAVGDGIHVDIADGKFVPNTLLSLDEIELPKKRYCEVHLIVTNPESYFPRCHKLGFNKVIVHVDALKDSSYSTILHVQEYAHSLEMEFYLAFQKGCIIDFSSHLEKLDGVMVMMIELGYSGKPFIESQVDIVKKLRAYYPTLRIQVDGHITGDTVKIVRNAGADAVVSTTYLADPDIEKKYLLLKNG